MKGLQFFGFFLPIILAVFIRGMWAAEKTYKQQMAMLDVSREIEPFLRLDALRDMRKISFQKHKLYVFWGKDPYQLYTGAARNLIPRDEA